MPPFAIRELGEGARVGRLNAINGILILVLAPAIGMMTRKYASYSMVILGGFITASSFVFMALPTSLFQGCGGRLARQGRSAMAISEIIGAVHPYYVMIFFWQVVFSVGEAFYSPRVYEYAASIAPKGQEASYASLSYVPLLIGKLITGAAFGGLLAKYCPAEGPRDPATMWLIIGLMVLVAPVGLFAAAALHPGEGRGQGRIDSPSRQSLIIPHGCWWTSFAGHPPDHPMKTHALCFIAVIVLHLRNASPRNHRSAGTIFIDPDIITKADPTTYVKLRYRGRAVRNMFDRRTNKFSDVKAHIFIARYSDSKDIEVQVNPEFGGKDKARVHAAQIFQSHRQAAQVPPRECRYRLDSRWPEAVRRRKPESSHPRPAVQGLRTGRHSGGNPGP